ncbi:putative NtrC family two-component response regulator [Pseudomonas sp. CFII64]|nr:putative NtrC family two-component response regulator [Pseudomonas sp. CFII64]
MPGLSGLQLLEEMLARSIRYPVIFVTACIGDLPELKARELGAVGYFKKPFNGAQLMSHIRGVLDAEQILEA